MLPFPIMSTYGNTLGSTDIIKKADAGLNTLYVLTKTGNLYARGMNTVKQLGKTDTSSVTDYWYASNSNVQDIWVNASLSALIQKNDNTWYYAGRGYPFVGTSTIPNTWFDISTMFNNMLSTSGSSVKYVSIGDYTCIVTLQNGRVYGSGFNSLYSQLGQGTTSNYNGLFDLGVSSVQKALTTPGGENTYLLGTDGTIRGAGLNQYYNLNDSSSTSNRSTFVTVTTGALDMWVSQTALYVLKSDGLYAVGRNLNGKFGTGVIDGNGNLLQKVSSMLPVQVYGSVSNTVHMVLSNGDVYGAGADRWAIGDGNSSTSQTTRATWSIVPDLKGSSYIAHGSYRTVAVKANRLYSCGYFDSTYPGLMPDYPSNVPTLSLLNVTGLV